MFDGRFNERQRWPANEKGFHWGIEPGSWWCLIVLCETALIEPRSGRPLSVITALMERHDAWKGQIYTVLPRRCQQRSVVEPGACRAHAVEGEEQKNYFFINY